MDGFGEFGDGGCLEGRIDGCRRDDLAVASFLKPDHGQAELIEHSDADDHAGDIGDHPAGVGHHLQAGLFDSVLTPIDRRLVEGLAVESQWVVHPDVDFSVDRAVEGDESDIGRVVAGGLCADVLVEADVDQVQRIRHVGSFESQGHLVGLAIDLDRLCFEVLAEDVATDLLLSGIGPVPGGSSQHRLDRGDIDLSSGVGPGPGPRLIDLDKPSGSFVAGVGLTSIVRRLRVLEVFFDFDGERQIGMLDDSIATLAIQESCADAFFGQRHDGDLVVVLGRRIDHGQFDGSDVLFEIDRVSLADTHLSFDRRDPNEQFVVHDQQHTHVQQDDSGSTSKDHDAPAQQDASSDEALGELPEDSE